MIYFVRNASTTVNSAVHLVHYSCIELSEDVHIDNITSTAGEMTVLSCLYSLTTKRLQQAEHVVTSPEVSYLTTSDTLISSTTFSFGICAMYGSSCFSKQIHVEIYVSKNPFKRTKPSNNNNLHQC